MCPQGKRKCTKESREFSRSEKHLALLQKKVYGVTSKYPKNKNKK